MERNVSSQNDNSAVLEITRSLRENPRLAYAASGDGFQSVISASPSWVGDPAVNLGVSAILIDGGDIEVTYKVRNVLKEEFEVPQTQWAGKTMSKDHLTHLSIVLRGKHKDTHSIFYQVATTGGAIFFGKDGEFIGGPEIRVIALQAWLMPKG